MDKRPTFKEHCYAVKTKLRNYYTHQHNIYIIIVAVIVTIKVTLDRDSH